MKHRTPVVPLLLAAIAASLSCADPQPAPRRVLLVILDTVRADHLSSYGYDRRTTPHLDRLAGEGERYTQAYAQSSWTLPTIATILTGQPPHAHGAGFADGVIFPLREGVPTLAGLLGAAGFETGGIWNVVWCQPQSGLAQGFGFYDYVMTDATNRNHRSASDTTDLALRWLGEQDPDASLFLAVHYFDPHLTYDPPAPFDSEFEPDQRDHVPEGFGSAGEMVRIRTGDLELTPRQRESLIARYDGELRYMDEQFGRLRAGMEQAGLWDDTLVVVIADHGEEFWDHGSFEHGHSHFAEVVRVPLIVRRPGGPAGVVRDERVRQLDVAPTILEYAGIPVPPGLPGHPLGRGGARYSVAEGTLYGGDLVSVRSDDGVLIVERSQGRAVFFTADDAREQRDASLELAEQAGLADIVRSLPPPRRPGDERWEPNEEQLRQLRSLGYVQ